MSSRVASLASLAAILLSVAPASAQTALLRYRWTKGDVVPYRMTLQTSSTMSGMPGIGEVVVSQTMVQEFHLTVDDVAADGSATLRETIDSIRMDMTSPMGSMGFDSATPVKSDDPVAAAISTPLLAMIGESITLVMLPTGKVTNLEGMSRIFEKLVKQMPENPEAAQLLNQMKTSMGDDAMRAALQQAFAGFPEYPARLGETWTSQVQMTNPILGHTTTMGTYTLDRIEAGTGSSIAHVKLNMSMTSDGPKPGSTRPMGMAVHAATLTMDGEMLFDIPKGRVQKTTLKSQVPMTLSMPGPDGGDPVTIQSVSRSTMTMEVLGK